MRAVSWALIGCVAWILSTTPALTAQQETPNPARVGGTANQWLAKCGTFAKGQPPKGGDSQVFNAGTCLGWVEGFLDMHFMYRAALNDEMLGFCYPTNGTIGQAAKIIVKYFEDHPSELHQPSRILAYAAFKEQFPCRQP
jgi:hypothetical protein